MQLYFGQTNQLFVEDVFTEHIGPAMWQMGFLGLIFLGLGLWFARLRWGMHTNRLREARVDSLALAERDREIIEEQNHLLAKLKKSSAIFNADITYRDNKIQKLESEFIRVQRDLNDKAAAENNLNQIIETRDSEVERLNVEINAVREELARQEETNLRLEELEKVIGERDGELQQLQSGNNELADLIKVLKVELGEKEETLAEYEQNLANSEGVKDKIVSLEELLTNRDNELSRLRNERDRMRNELESTLRNREAKIMELEDSLGDRESMIVALQNELEDGGDMHSRIKEFENLVAERELEIEELKNSHVSHGELENLREQLRIEKERAQEETDHLVKQLRQRDSEIQNIKKQYHEAKQQREAKFREMVSQLEASEAELISLRALQSTTDKLKARLSGVEEELDEKDSLIRRIKSEREDYADRVAKLESDLEDKNEELKKLRNSGTGDGSELEQLRRENGDLFRQLRNRDDELSMRGSNSGGYDQIRDRMNDLERMVRDRDDEMDRLRRKNEDLVSQLKSRDNDIRLMKVERIPHAERNGGVVEVERNAPDDLYARIAELERMVGERKRERSVRANRSFDSSEYRFTLADGTVTYLKGDETIEFEGKNYRAEDLYYLLNDR